MDFGTLSAFHGGLDALVGPPKPPLHAAMTAEHCESADSHTRFEAANYGTVTTSCIEYHFVKAPTDTTLRTLQLDTWPAETRIPYEEHRRQPRPLASFRPELRKINARLKRLECAPVGDDELVAVRLYTGPM